MRVTGVIKDYITSEVNKKCDEKLKELPNPRKEAMDKMEEELDKIQDRANQEAIKVAEKYGFYGKENYFNNYSTYGIETDIKDTYSTEAYKLKKEAKDKITEIILDLELGETNKKELSGILENISF